MTSYTRHPGEKLEFTKPAKHGNRRPPDSIQGVPAFPGMTFFHWVGDL
jgi:hypothetical protein